MKTSIHIKAKHLDHPSIFNFQYIKLFTVNPWKTDYTGVNTVQCRPILSQQSLTFIYKALFTSADVTKCYTETQPETLNSNQCSTNLGRNLERNQAVPGGDFKSTSQLWCSSIWPLLKISKKGNDKQIIIKIIHAPTLQTLSRYVK